MSQRTLRGLSSPCLLLVALALGCPQAPAPPVAQTPASQGGAAIPAELFLPQRPAEARSLAEVKAKSKPGDEVLFEARVGGRAEPFVAKRALFLVADPALPACSDSEGDRCQTPWDYCCEEPQALLRHTATVRFVDAEGRPLATSAQDAGGLSGLKTVVVRGKVSEANEDGLFVVDAEGVWIEPGPSPGSRASAPRAR